MKEVLRMQPVISSENINIKKYVVWMGTDDNPKMKKHNKELSCIEADELIKKLSPIFTDVKFIKEEI